MEADLLQQAAVVIAGVAVLGIGVLAWWGTSKFAEGSIVREAVLRASVAVRQAVGEVKQTYVDAIKQGTAPDSPGGRSLTEGERKHALDMCLARAKSLLGLRGLKILAKAFGIFSGGEGGSSLENWLTSEIEATVAEQPSVAGTVMVAVPSDPSRPSAPESTPG